MANGNKNSDEDGDPADRINSANLTDIIDHCFDLSMDGAFKPDQQAAILTAGKRLRGYLLNLLSARFEAGTQAVEDANKQIEGCDRLLSEGIIGLDQMQRALGELAALGKVLDVALSVATKFV
jgi:hypothetical protein